MRLAWAVIAFGLLGGCDPAPPPPPARSFEGLPVTGSRAFAEKLGFTPCIDTSNALRCRKAGVMLLGAGPYSAAVDLRGSGESGFDELTLWHDDDQSAVLAVADRLKELGWTLCRTGQEDRGDQDIWTKAGAPVRFSMDVSYWGKRRMRVLPEQNQPTGRCW